MELYETKLKDLTNQLERQCELHHDAIRRAKQAESENYESNTMMRNLEGELATGDVLRDTLRNDKQKVDKNDTVQTQYRFYSLTSQYLQCNSCKAIHILAS